MQFTVTREGKSLFSFPLQIDNLWKIPFLTELVWFVIYLNLFCWPPNVEHI
jgi:hypothetical protein